MFNLPENLVDPMKIQGSIEMLNEYVKDESISPLISALEALKEDPGSESLLAKVSEALNGLGVLKGAVLTYAPYVWLMLAEDPFDD